MSRIPYIAAGCGVAFVVWGVAFIRQEPPRTQPALILAPPTLHQRWNDAIQYTTPFQPQPRVVQTIKIAPEREPEVKVIEEQKPVVKSTPRERVKKRRSTDCRVHGMRKVYTNRGRSWRCKR